MDLRESTVFKLHRATTLLNRVSDGYLTTHHQLHYAPFLVLLAVRISGPSSQHAIAQSLDVSRASVTQRLQVLRKQRLVRITVDDSDPRANVVDLTAAGKRLTDAAWQGLEGTLEAVAAGVDDAALRHQLDRLLGNAATALDHRPHPAED